MANDALLQLELPEAPKLKSGKVREVFDLGDSLLFVATDRISAFDCVMPNGVPDKGVALTQLSHFWFDRLEALCPNHRLKEERAWPARLSARQEALQPRSMIVAKATPLPIECVVRGYLAGSGWKEYQRDQSVCGLILPAGLQESSELPKPIFTPATKAESGHDENISFEEAASRVGRDTAERVRDLSLRLYSEARSYARGRGLIIADTKFEFGRVNGELVLIDEALTSDSSRFWPADDYEPGRPQKAFDKQFVRDYLLTLDWDRTPPAPPLPADIVAKTRDRYFEAYRLLTGKDLAQR